MPELHSGAPGKLFRMSRSNVNALVMFAILYNFVSSVAKQI